MDDRRDWCIPGIGTVLRRLGLSLRRSWRAGAWCLVCLLMIHVATGAVLALPQGGMVAHGDGAISVDETAMTVSQGSHRLIIDWHSFGVDSSESVVFHQPSSRAIALNRVVGREPSDIHGSLTANGQVFLLNPNGILFGRGAKVNVGGLLASTFALSNEAFLAGDFRLADVNGAVVVNEGEIKSAPGGYVALVSRRVDVSDDGEITAPGGDVALAAGGAVQLLLGAEGLLKAEVDEAAIGAQVNHGGVITADGGMVLLSADAGDALVDTVVNHEGMIRAQTVANEGGAIYLLGGVEGGTVRVAGSLDASAPAGGDGGFIETSGAIVMVEGSPTVTTAAARGKTGTWLIDPTDFIVGTGGNITGEALGESLERTDVTLETAAAAGGLGDISVNEDVSWSSDSTLTLLAHRNIAINADVTSASGGSVSLRADSDADGSGSVTFGDDAFISMVDGIVSIYYQPVAYDDPVSKSDVSGNPFVPFVSDGDLTAYMLVYDVEDLQAMRKNSAGIYALAADIDAQATRDWDSGAGFEPIGTNTTPFSGVLNGLDHAVHGLYIDRPDLERVGLFGVVDSGGHVQRLGLTDLDVTGGESGTGGLAGESRGSLNDVYVTGRVRGTDVVGGIAGGNAGTIMDAFNWSDVGAMSLGGPPISEPPDTDGSSSSGSVSVGGGAYVGGLAGKNDGVIRRAYNSGDVTGGMYLGGIAGSNAGDIAQVYNSGGVGGSLTLPSIPRPGESVSGSVDVSFDVSFVGGLEGSGSRLDDPIDGVIESSAEYVGGLVGRNSVDGVVSTAYNIGSVRGTAHVGGAAGTNDGVISVVYSSGAVDGETLTGGLVGAQQGELRDSYWDVGTANQVLGVGSGSDGSALGMTTQQLMIRSTYTNSGTRWDFADDWFMIEGETRPFLRMEHQTEIRNAHQLQLMAVNLDGEYTMVNDIDLGAALILPGGMWDASGFVPVGSTSQAFRGAFDGGGRTIDGLTIDRSALDGVGLFGAIDSSLGSVRNVGLTDVDIVGREYVGALAGWSRVDVSSVYSTGQVRGDGTVGGLVGYHAPFFEIAQSYSDALVAGNEYVGGLIGSNDGRLNQVFATGAVYGTLSAGGLAGSNNGEIVLAYSTGPVGGGGWVGGLVGENEGIIEHAYSAGTLSRFGVVGGLVGLAGEGSTVESAYWDVETSDVDGAFGSDSGYAHNVGGKPTWDLQDAQNPIFGLWDFQVWGVDDAHSYPYFRWRFPEGPSVVSGRVAGVSTGQRNLGVDVAVDGEHFGAAYTGANGVYYKAIDPVIDAESAVLVWLNGTRSWAESGSIRDEVGEWGNTLGHTALDISAGWVRVGTRKEAFSETVTDVIQRAKGSTLPDDGMIRFFTVGSEFRVTPDANLEVVATADDIVLDQPLTAKGLKVTASKRLTVADAMTATDGPVTLHAFDDLTLSAEASVGGSASDVAIVLSAGGEFVNHGGADVLDPTGGGRWLVFAADPALSEFGGLDSGNTAIWGRPFNPFGPSAPSVAAAGNRYLFAVKPTITVSSINLEKTYGDMLEDGALASAYVVDVPETGVAGAFLSHGRDEAYSGAPRLHSDGAASNAPVVESPYVISVSQGNLTSSAGYGFQLVDKGRLTVNPRALRITGLRVSEKAYDGTTTATLLTNGVKLSGARVHDDVTLDVSAAMARFTETDAAESVPVTVTGLGLSGSDSSNYTLIQPAGFKAAIKPTSLIVQAHDAFRSTDAPNPDFTFGYHGFVGGDGPEVVTGDAMLATTARETSPPGRYLIAFTGATLTAKNYVIRYEPGVLTVVAPKTRPPVPEPECRGGVGGGFPFSNGTLSLTGGIDCGGASGGGGSAESLIRRGDL